MGYILFYFLNSILAIKHYKIKHVKYLDILIFFSLILFSSVRWDVGGDFSSYVKYYDEILVKSPLKDILYFSLNYFFYLFNFEIVGKNIVLIILFLLPFYYIFKNYFHNIYLSLCIFFPIIFIVYGLGSIRQGLAISYFFLFLYYDDNKLVKYLLFFVPLFFHQASIILLLIYIGSQIVNFNNKKKFITSCLIFSTLSLIIFFVNYDYFNQKIIYYILEDTYISVGAPVRAILLSIFSLFFLLKMKNFNFIDERLKKFLFFSSLIIIFSIPFSFYMSTPVDRILGFLLINKLIISEELLKSTKNMFYKNLFSIFIIFIGFAYLVSWIYFGKNSFMWNRFDLFF